LARLWFDKRKEFMSENPNETLPKSKPGRSTSFPTVPVAEVPRSSPSGDREAYRPVVLVVDDERAIADTLTKILNHGAYAAMAAYDAESALETALLVPPQMLIADVVLPGMSGIELAIALEKRIPDCRILLFSGMAATAGLLAEANRAGHSFQLLSKPVHPSDLLAHLSTSLRVSSAKS
jgi:DNA-binding response OmpR family regulator